MGDAIKMLVKDLVPPHGVRDEDKLASITADMRANGWIGRPILATADGSALTGSHRIAAAVDAGLTVIPVLVIDADGQDDPWLLISLFTVIDDEDRLSILSGFDKSAADLMAVEIDCNYDFNG